MCGPAGLVTRELQEELESEPGLGEEGGIVTAAGPVTATKLEEDAGLLEHSAFGSGAWPTPEEGLLAGETREVILSAVESLPAAQRAVIILRDIEGRPAGEACTLLELDEGYQRVLLNRARTSVRGALDSYFDASDEQAT